MLIKEKEERVDKELDNVLDYILKHIMILK